MLTIDRYAARLRYAAYLPMYHEALLPTVICTCKSSQLHSCRATPARCTGPVGSTQSPPLVSLNFGLGQSRCSLQRYQRFKGVARVALANAFRCTRLRASVPRQHGLQSVGAAHLRCGRASETRPGGSTPLQVVEADEARLRFRTSVLPKVAASYSMAADSC